MTGHRPLAPAAIPAAAWAHINALPALWTARDQLQQRLSRPHARTARHDRLLRHLARLNRQALEREACLNALGVPVDQILRLASSAPPRPYTETEH